ncbi:MAG: hypothetical protein HQK83_08100 [Fibrobacteria bacterium]|nr:hypothetical protein [Fibrobacteria bacterium]
MGHLGILLYGVYLSAEKFLGIHKWNMNKNLFLKIVGFFLTFNLICITWIFFRSPTVQCAFVVVSKIVTLYQFLNIYTDYASLLVSIIFNISILIFLEYFLLKKYSFKELALKKSPFLLFGLNASLFIILFGVPEGSHFIYFQF